MAAVAGIAVLIVSLGYLAAVARTGLGDLPDFVRTPTAVASIIAGVAIYVAATLVWSGGWAALLNAVGQRVSVLAAFSIIGISQVAKYFPGNFAHHVGRAALATQFGLGSAGVVLSMALEFFLMVGAAVASGLLALALTDAATAEGISPLGPGTLSAVLAASVLAPLVALAAVRRWGATWLTQRQEIEGTHVPDLAWSSANFFSHFATFLLHGVIFALLARGVFVIPFTNYWLGVGAFALAFVAGFLAPGVPAGIGVREAVLVAAFSLDMSTGSALALATAHRAVNVVGDGVVFGLALAGRRYLRTSLARAP